jgi:hypothetical protein
MAASYPAAVKTFTTKENNVDVYDADHINDQQNEITAIETELGTDVAGSAATLKARLAIGISDAGGVQGGSSFPGTPTPRQLFYRTDLEILYVRDHADTTWTTLQGSLSNVTFSFAIGGDYTVNSYGVTLDDLMAAPATAIMKLAWSVNGTTGRDILQSKFTKTAGVNTVTVYARGWSVAGNASQTVVLVSIGGQTGTASTTSNSETPNWVNFTVDVSSLNNGTVYDILISIRTSSSGMAFMDSIIGFGST